MNCNLVFSNIKPENEEIEEVYMSYGRNDYLSEVTIKRYHELLDKFEKFRKTNRILDVGCGIGYFLEVAKERGWEVYGTEFTDNAVEICKSKGIIMHKGVVEPEMFEEGFFDVITSIEVVEHLWEPAKDIKMLNKYLRKGGVLYITTPNFDSMNRIKQGVS